MQTQTTTTPPSLAPTGNRQWINANPLAIDHPNDRRFLIEPKKALVLWGEQGSGKTTFAQNVAQGNGTFAVVNWQVFQYVGGTYQYICENESTLIIEDTPIDKKTWATIKALATQKTLTINSKNQPPRHVPMPRLIFICNEKPPIPEDSRHFKLIEIRELKPIPLWYKVFADMILEMGNMKSLEDSLPDFHRISGYIQALFMSNVINGTEFSVLNTLQRDVFNSSYQKSKTEKETNYAPL